MSRLLLTLFAFLPTQAFAVSYSFSGSCPSAVGGTFSIAFDIDPTGRPGQFGQGTTYDIITPNVTMCGLLPLTTMDVVDDGGICEPTPEDFITLSNPTNALAVLLSDTDADQFSDESPPLTIDLAQFELNAASSFCAAADPVRGFVNFAAGVGAPPPPPPTFTVVQRMEFVQTIGSSTYFDLGLPGTPQLRTATEMEASLQRPIDELTAAGCTLDGHVGGAYGPSAFDGGDADGDLLDAQIERSAKTFQLTLSDGTTLVDGVYNRQMQSFADVGTDGFAVGRFFRSRGANGTFYGVTGTCPVVVDTRSIVSGWYRGPLPGED